MQRIANQDRRVEALLDNIGKVIKGKAGIIELVVTALLAPGHVLIEDVPGVGKTKLATALAVSCGGTFGRIQMTPDIMPSDVTGFSFLRPGSYDMEFRRGAVFCNFLLADEINRASPKSQSALLESMEEHSVTIDEKTYRLPEPFMVLATQNPVETFGTFPLPEAQMDRFLFRLHIGYPDKEDELSILQRESEISVETLGSVVSLNDILFLRECARNVYISASLERYILEIVHGTREAEEIRLGVSPRGSIALHKAAKAYAFLKGRDFVLPDDIKYLCPYSFAHRISLSAKGKSVWGNGFNAIEKIVSRIEVPV
ncbi:MAG: MoxR family ATPase [Lachnospiraceae bacterium]|nr:MoxR family ATPase [Lachnospiraceae bacterium]